MSKSVFIGRQHELKALRSLLKKTTASLIVIKGRRRIGKSQLAKEFGKKYRFLVFSGLSPESNTTAQDERNEFSRQLSINTGLPEGHYDDWRKLFHLLALQTTQGRVIILLDEISWMGSKDLLFLGKLKNAWDLQFKNNPELILILCGSVSAWIEKNILSSTGFMGRLSLDLTLEELPLQDACRLLQAQGGHFNAHEIFKIVSVTSGVPRYLEEIRASLSADENIRRLCFEKSGILFREFNDIFHDLFTTKSQYYKKIVELLINEHLDFTEICQRLQVKKSGFWSEYLSELVKAGFLKRYFNWSLVSGKISRLSYFHLSDNYLRFYLKYIEPNQQAIQTRLFEHKTVSSLLGWDSLMGLQFENLMLNNAPAIWKALNLDSQDILAHGPYFQRKTQRHKGAQIDYLIKTRHNTFIACEIKFSRKKITSKVIEPMKEKLTAIKIPSGHAFWPVLIYVNGVTEQLKEKRYFTHLIDFSELLH